MLNNISEVKSSENTGTEYTLRILGIKSSFTIHNKPCLLAFTVTFDLDLTPNTFLLVISRLWVFKLKIALHT